MSNFLEPVGCCIYEKPRMFGESSSESEDDDECKSCRGHKNKCFKSPEDGRLIVTPGYC